MSGSALLTVGLSCSNHLDDPVLAQGIDWALAAEAGVAGQHEAVRPTLKNGERLDNLAELAVLRTRAIASSFSSVRAERPRKGDASTVRRKRDGRLMIVD
jgi:hypothetical protein